MKSAEELSHVIGSTKVATGSRSPVRRGDKEETEQIRIGNRAISSHATSQSAEEREAKKSKRKIMRTSRMRTIRNT